MYKESKKYLFKLIPIHNTYSKTEIIEDTVTAFDLTEAISRVESEYGGLELYQDFHIRELVH